MADFSASGKHYGRVEGVSLLRRGAALTARGDQELSRATLGDIAVLAVGTDAELMKLNTQILRTVVDCLVVGDAIANEASSEIAQLSIDVHSASKAQEHYVLDRLQTGTSETARRLAKYLSPLPANPELAMRNITSHLKFDECLPTDVGGESALFEDALARAAVISELARDHARARGFASASIVFRCPDEAILPRHPPSLERQREFDDFQAAISREVSPLVNLAECLMVRATQMQNERDLEFLTPLHEAFRTLFALFNVRHAWRPLSYSMRADFLQDLRDFCGVDIALGFPDAEPVLECFAALHGQLNMLTPISSGVLAKSCKGMEKLLGQPFFEVARLWMRDAARGYGIRLEE